MISTTSSNSNITAMYLVKWLLAKYDAKAKSLNKGSRMALKHKMKSMGDSIPGLKRYRVEVRWQPEIFIYEKAEATNT